MAKKISTNYFSYHRHFNSYRLKTRKCCGLFSAYFSSPASFWIAYLLASNAESNGAWMGWHYRNSSRKSSSLELLTSVISALNQKSPVKDITTSWEKSRANWITAPRRQDPNISAQTRHGFTNDAWATGVCAKNYECLNTHGFEKQTSIREEYNIRSLSI